MVGPKVFILTAMTASVTASAYSQDQQMLDVLLHGDPVAQVAPGDLIAVTHCASLLEKSGIEVAVRDSPYRLWLEASGPSTVLVGPADLARARNILSDYAKQGFVTLGATKAQSVPQGYKFIGLSELATSDMNSDRDKVLTRSLSSFVEQVMPRRHMNVTKLGIRQRKYFASAEDSHLSVGYDVIVVTKQPDADASATYYMQFLSTKGLTNWELLPGSSFVTSSSAPSIPLSMALLACTAQFATSMRFGSRPPLNISERGDSILLSRWRFGAISGSVLLSFSLPGEDQRNRCGPAQKKD